MKAEGRRRRGEDIIYVWQRTLASDSFTDQASSQRNTSLSPPDNQPILCVQASVQALIPSNTVHRHERSLTAWPPLKSHHRRAAKLPPL